MRIIDCMINICLSCGDTMTDFIDPSNIRPFEHVCARGTKEAIYGYLRFVALFQFPGSKPAMTWGQGSPQLVSGMLPTMGG